MHHISEHMITTALKTAMHQDTTRKMAYSELSQVEQAAVYALGNGPRYDTHEIPPDMPQDALFALFTDCECLHVGRTGGVKGARSHVMNCAHCEWGHVHKKIMRKVLAS